MCNRITLVVTLERHANDIKEHLLETLSVDRSHDVACSLGVSSDSLVTDDVAVAERSGTEHGDVIDRMFGDCKAELRRVWMSLVKILVIRVCLMLC